VVYSSAGGRGLGLGGVVYPSAEGRGLGRVWCILVQVGVVL
jgi:hypothetical protein